VQHGLTFRKLRCLAELRVLLRRCTKLTIVQHGLAFGKLTCLAELRVLLPCTKLSILQHGLTFGKLTCLAELRVLLRRCKKLSIVQHGLTFGKLACLAELRAFLRRCLFRYQMGAPKELSSALDVFPLCELLPILAQVGMMLCLCILSDTLACLKELGLMLGDFVALGRHECKIILLGNLSLDMFSSFALSRLVLGNLIVLGIVLNDLVLGK